MSRKEKRRADDVSEELRRAKMRCAAVEQAGRGRSAGVKAMAPAAKSAPAKNGRYSGKTGQ